MKHARTLFYLSALMLLIVMGRPSQATHATWGNGGINRRTFGSGSKS